ncbi:hypothetical protein BT96DRAFT_982037 [Gymnopus androsaceus JB14]|uniref:Uncharacterized protein n=1 Tax=Gymnopus androsaceus JB14 TaxID=1447944 RepID=A0A6A4GIS1_9AGAR|nr:hypothetical protein BT96DRAFT_982037 [Gymnopus androsaceus JB14]
MDRVRRSARVSSILRITSPKQLDIPALHEEAKKCFDNLFPKDAQELARFKCEHAEEAMALALQNDIHRHNQTHPRTIHPNSSDRFTPLLFTPPPTSHMNCTDALAEHWMSMVISPAIDNSAMGKPLQTLESMKGVDWVGLGLCEACAKDKIDEWTEEQAAVWETYGWSGFLIRNKML